MSHQDRLRDALTAGDLKGAERHAMAALRDSPSDGMFLARLGSIQMSLGRAHEGVDALRQAVAALPQAGIVWNGYGVALAATGAARKAEVALRKALSLAPEIPQNHCNYGKVLRGGLEEAAFGNVRRYDWRETDIGKAGIDDYIQAYLPHMDKENGRLMALNVEADKPV